MSVPPQLIWFQLVDAANGSPYKGTTATSILRTSLAVPIVDFFRKAVKAENPNSLSHVDPLHLLVYKNQGAFDKRNAAVDKGKEEPFKSSHPLDGLGETEEDALIVVVVEGMKTLGLYFSISHWSPKHRKRASQARASTRPLSLYKRRRNSSHFADG